MRIRGYDPNLAMDKRGREERMSLPKPYYEHDGIQIFHGDCRVIAPLVRADVVVTSPPYNVGLKYLGYDDQMPQELFERFNQEWLEAVTQSLNPSARVYIVLSDKMVFWMKPLVERTGLTFVQLMAWCKPNLAGGASISLDWNCLAEWILLFRYGTRTPMMSGEGTTHNWFVIPSPQRNWNGDDSKQHVAQFPLKLPRRILARTPGEIVLDPFMGSGSTLRAAKDLRRKAIGIEIEEKYCEIAAKRLEQEVFDFGYKST